MSMNAASRRNESEVVRISPPVRSRVFRLAKRVLQASFALLALPRTFAYQLSRRTLGRRAFGASSESIARVPGLRGVYLRQAFYRGALARCGQDVYFGWQSVFSMAEARIGHEVYIGRFCSIGYGDIGDGAMLADGAQILSGGDEHDHAANSDTSMREQSQTYRRVTIGKNAWIGAGAVVMADVGEGAIIGAGAVVTRPVPAFAVAVGVPARLVKTSTEDRAESPVAVRSPEDATEHV